jgi:hypothetical protein
MAYPGDFVAVLPRADAQHAVIQSLSCATTRLDLMVAFSLSIA